MRAMLTGQLLAKRYRVGRALAAGGMGRIFSGVDMTDGSPVVLKLPQTDHAERCSNCARLEREATAAAGLESPHLVRFVSAGALHSGMPFLVLERLEGIDLGALIRDNGPLPIARAVSYVRQACLGLAAIHAAGLVHRDVKPSNLFLCTRTPHGPCVKVIDLGLVKDTHAPAADPSLTGDHMLLGSPSYVSPEQMRQLDVDARTDIWSLGVVLFELLSGSRPFQGPTIVDVCAQILTRPVPSIRDHISDIDPALDAVIQRCLAKERDERYGSVLELSEALRPFDRAPAPRPALAPTSERTPTSLPAKIGREHRNSRVERWYVAMTALLLALAAASWAAPRKGSDAADTSMSPEAPRDFTS